ncbi:MAG: hypothetical protein KDD63_28510, partial [Bacteroidetes bacterium]|nr:hypothetical protein [Bacteroidota bacterium]
MKGLILLFSIITSLLVPHFIWGQESQVSINGNPQGYVSPAFARENYFISYGLGTARLYNITQGGLVKTQQFKYFWDGDEAYIYAFGQDFEAGTSGTIFFQIKSWENEKVVFEFESTLQFLGVHPQKKKLITLGDPFNLRFKELTYKFFAGEMEHGNKEKEEYNELAEQQKSQFTVVSVPEGQKEIVLETGLKLGTAIYSQDGRYLYVIGSIRGHEMTPVYQIKKYDTRTWAIESEATFGQVGFSYKLSRSRFSPDGNYLAIPANQSQHNQLHVFELNHWTNPKLSISNAGDYSFRFHANSKYLAALKVMDIAESIRSVFLAQNSVNVSVFDLESGQKLTSVRKAETYQFHPDKPWLLTSYVGKNGKVLSSITDFEQNKI